MARCARSGCGRWRPDALVRHGRIGVSLNDAWYCSIACLESEAQAVLDRVNRGGTWRSPAPAFRLGRVLLRHQIVSEAALEAALRTQQETGRRLGEELVAQGLATPEDVLRALATQCGVGYLVSLDVARVAAGPGGLAPETVRALRVVPFEANSRRQLLRVACTAPLPRLALAAVREITEWSVEPFLVDDALLDRLVAGYGQALGSGESGDARPLRSIPDAAARIARAARQGRASRMHHVRCDAYLWVRLEGGSTPEDLMVAIDQTGEASWQVEPTLH